MAQPVLHDSRCTTRRTTAPGVVGDPTIGRLGRVIAALVNDADPPILPDWDYVTWCRALAYPDLRARVRVATKELGYRRDEVLFHPTVKLLVEWAGSRKRDDPVAGAAAALAALSWAALGAGGAATSVAEVARLVAEMVDSAAPMRPCSSSRTRLSLLVDPERLPAADNDPVVVENPLLGAAVGELLDMAGVDLEAPFVTFVEGAVVQAGDWWTRHSVPVPTSIDGPRLPGVRPAQQLCPSERLSTYVSDRALLGLVAGPHPGRARPCQVAWRRGLTYWVAARLSTPESSYEPPVETIRWWRSELALLALASRDEAPVAAELARA